MYDRLNAAGLDVKGTVNRFGGRMDLYLRFLEKFPDDPNFGLIEPALEKADYEEIFKAVHTMKGITGNLGMTELYGICSEMSEMTRDANVDSELLRIKYNQLKSAYDVVVEVIAGILETK